MIKPHQKSQNKDKHSKFVQATAKTHPQDRIDPTGWEAQ
jgi:hypothetical protein